MPKTNEFCDHLMDRLAPLAHLQVHVRRLRDLDWEVRHFRPVHQLSAL